MRIDPPVSEPTAAGARPAATATAEPLLEPPATRCVFVSQGFHGAPIGALRPHAPYANSTRCVLPSGIMPAASRWSAALAVSAAMPCGRAFDPAVVLRPRICTRSLIAIGSPCSGPRAAPERRSRSALAAAARASSRYTSMKAYRWLSSAAMRARYVATISRDEAAPLTSSCASSVRESQCRSFTISVDANSFACGEAWHLHSIPPASLRARRAPHFHFALELELPGDVHAPGPRCVHILSRRFFSDFELRMPDANRIRPRRQLGDDRFAVLAGLGEVRRLRNV